MQCSDENRNLAHFIAVSTFHYCREHFSLAKPLHLAIMSGQLSNGWDAGFHKDACVKP
jgi:hypothetical protein